MCVCVCMWVCVCVCVRICEELPECSVWLWRCRWTPCSGTDWLHAQVQVPSFICNRRQEGTGWRDEWEGGRGFRGTVAICVFAVGNLQPLLAFDLWHRRARQLLLPQPDNWATRRVECPSPRIIWFRFGFLSFLLPTFFWSGLLRSWVWSLAYGVFILVLFHLTFRCYGCCFCSNRSSHLAIILIDFQSQLPKRLRLIPAPLAASWWFLMLFFVGGMSCVAF